MKVSVKTLNGELFQIEVESSDQVSNVKQKIQDSRASLVVERQKLIHSGKVLKDEQTVGELGLAESDFIVCMITKEIAKKPIPEPPKPAQPAPAAAPEPKIETPAINASLTPPASTTPPPTNLYSNETLNALTNMGFPENECRAALNAAMGNPDLAYEFLLTGIPERASPARAPQPAQSTSIEQLRQHPQFNTLKRVVQQNPAALSQVLDLIGQQNPSLLAAIHANNDAFLAMMNEPIVEGSPANPSPPAPVASGAPQPNNHAQMLQFLNGLPAEQRALFAQSMGMSPDQLQSFLNMMSTLPASDLNNMLNSHMMDEGENDPPGVIRLTHEEMAAVNRLMALGFSQQQAAQAYLACDKNEALAANLLLEGGWAEDDNDYDGGHEDSFR